MSIEILCYSPLNRRWGPSIKKKIKCNGLGTEEDPFIIDGSVYLPTRFWLKDFESHLIIKKPSELLDYINIINCKNILIDTCKIRGLYLSHCSNIKITNSFFFKWLVLNSSDSNNIINNKIRELNFNQSHNNYFKQNYIKKIKITFSGENKFEKNKIKEEDIKKLEKGHSKSNLRKDFFKWYYPPVLIVYCFLFVGSIFWYSLNYLMLIFLILSFPILTIFLYYFFIYNYISEREQLGPNIIT